MIKKWHLKAVLQKLISVSPVSNRVNYFFQRTMGNVDLDDTMFWSRITHGFNHVENFEYHHTGGDNRDLKALELGTGWYPIVPMALYLSGFSEITSVDIISWLRIENILKTIRKFEQWKNDEKLLRITDAFSSKRWENLVEIREKYQGFTGSGEKLGSMCKEFNFHPVVADARHLDMFHENEFDLVCSNNTFANIPEAILRDIILEMYRVVRKNGVMSHHIDMSDHWSHFDHSINEFNFLRYSPSAWRWINSAVNYQNRLRFCELKDIYDSLNVPYMEANVYVGEEAHIDIQSLDERFKNMQVEELKIIGGYLLTSAKCQ